MSSTEATGVVVQRLDSLYEFERAPVTPDKLEPGSSFAGLFSGEHVAATEFVIGALVVSFGPVGVLTAVVYVALSAVAGAREALPPEHGAAAAPYFVAGTLWMNEHEKRRSIGGR